MFAGVLVMAAIAGVVMLLMSTAAVLILTAIVVLGRSMFAADRKAEMDGAAVIADVAMLLMNMVAARIPIAIAALVGSTSVKYRSMSDRAVTTAALF
jgi:hypothetical protein